MAGLSRSPRKNAVPAILAVLVLLSCRDDRAPLLGPEPTSLSPTIPLDCKVSVRAGTMSCAERQPTIGRGAQGDLIVAGQNLYVRLLSNNIRILADTFAFDVRLTNLIRQPMNTEDGITPSPLGIKIFFLSGPTILGTPGGSPSISIANADGSAAFTSTGQLFFLYSSALLPPDGILAKDEISALKTWKFRFTQVDSFGFTVAVSAPVQYPNGWVDIHPANPSPLDPGQTLQLIDSVFTAVGTHQPGAAVTWSTSNAIVATVSGSGLVNAVAQGSAYIKATAGSRVDSVLIVVNNSPIPDNDQYEALGNVARIVAAATGLLVGDTDPNGNPLSVTARTIATVRGGVLTTLADGSFTYVSAPGFAGGRDSARYVVSDGVEQDSAFAIFQVRAAHVWYVENDFAGVENGTSVAPFNTLGEAATMAPAGDSILVYVGGAADAAAIALKNSQVVIGEGVSFDLTAILDGVSTIYFDATGSRPLQGRGFPLAGNNTIRGVDVSSTVEGIIGSGFGLLTVSEVSVTTTGVAAIDLSNGALDAAFDSITSAGATAAAVRLVNTTGALAASAGTLNGVQQGVHITGGTIGLDYLGNIDQPNATGSLVTVDGGHSAGTVSFSGILTGAGRTALDFNAANGIYTFLGDVVLTGSDRGIVVLNSAGNFLFDFFTAIDAPVREGLTVTGGAPTVSYTGSITTGAADGIPVEVSQLTGGAIDISGTITSDGRGIVVTGNSGGSTIVFSGSQTLTLATSRAGVSVLNNAGATVQFTGGSLRITADDTVAFQALGGGILEVTGTGNRITHTAPSANSYGVHIENTTIGPAGVTFRTISSDGALEGIHLRNTGAGYFAVSGAVFGSNTGGIIQNALNAAVSLMMTDSVALNFMRITASPQGVIAEDFGALSANTTTIQSTGAGAVLSLTNGNLYGSMTELTGGKLRFLNVNGLANGGVGSITASADTAILVSGGTLTFTYSGTVTQAGSQPLLFVRNHATGNLEFLDSLTATTGEGLQFENADGTYDFNGTVTLNGEDAGIDITNGSSGQFSWAEPTSQITNPTGVGFRIDASDATGAYAGGITKTNAGGYAVHVSRLQGAASDTFAFTGTITAGNASTGVRVSEAQAAVSFNQLQLGTAAARFAITPLELFNNSGNVSLGNVNIFTSGATALLSTVPASSSGGLTSSAGVIDAIGASAIEISHSTDIQPLALSLTTVNSSGGTNGILLTRTSGSFVVTGNTSGLCGGQVSNTTTPGTPATVTAPNIADCSGGTILSSISDGIRLNIAENVSLTRMNIMGSGDNGIFGTQVNGFVLQSSHVFNNGNAVGDAGLRFSDGAGIADGLIGSAGAPNPTTITNSTIRQSGGHNVQIINRSGSLADLSIGGSVISDNKLNAAGGDDGLNIEIRSSAVAVIRAANSVFGSNLNQGIDARAFDTGNLTFLVSASTFTTNGDGAALTQSGGSSVTTIIGGNAAAVGNTFQAQANAAIMVRNSSTATASGRLNAIVGFNHVNRPAAALNNHAVLAALSGAGTVSSVNLRNNTVVNDGAGDALLIDTPDPGSSPVFGVSALDNVVSGGAGSAHGVVVNASQASTACVHLQGNTGTVQAGSSVARVVQVAAALFNLKQGLSASFAPATVMTDNHPGVPTSVSGAITVVSNASCITP